MEQEERSNYNYKRMLFMMNGFSLGMGMLSSSPPLKVGKKNILSQHSRHAIARKPCLFSEDSKSLQESKGPSLI
ncbi:MAG: hypothetical protein ABIN89_04300 [Chitinophagaceae bacterium]